MASSGSDCDRKQVVFIPLSGRHCSQRARALERGPACRHAEPDFQGSVYSLCTLDGGDRRLAKQRLFRVGNNFLAEENHRNGKGKGVTHPLSFIFLNDLHEYRLIPHGVICIEVILKHVQVLDRRTQFSLGRNLGTISDNRGESCTGTELSAPRGDLTSRPTPMQHKSWQPVHLISSRSVCGSHLTPPHLAGIKR